MLEDLNKIISQDEMIEGSDLKKILGSDARIKAFATFWSQNGDRLRMVFSAKLIKWTSEKEFNKEELEAYRSALSVFPSFFSNCWKEIDEQAQKLQKKDD